MITLLWLAFIGGVYVLCAIVAGHWDHLFADARHRR